MLNWKRIGLFVCCFNLCAIGIARGQNAPAPGTPLEPVIDDTIKVATVPVEPPPSAAAAAAAKKLVIEVFKDDLAAAGPATQDALAWKMFDEALRTGGPGAGEFALLGMAREGALKVGDFELGVQIACRMGERFGADKSASLVQLVDASSTPPAGMDAELARRSAYAALSLSSGQYASEAYGQAARTAAVAAGFAAATQDQGVATRFSSVAALMKASAAAFEKAAPSIRRLVAAPTDPAACQAAGQFYCFDAGAWEKGLPLLARGSDPALKQLAQLELANSTLPADQLALADAWARAGKSPGSPAAMNRRAAHWYELAMQAPNNAVRIAACQRLASIESGQLEPGVWCEYFLGTAHRRRLLTRVEPAIDFDWHSHRPEPEVQPDYFSSRWSGWLKTTQSGTYTFRFKHDDDGRLWIDGVELIRSHDWGTDELALSLSSGLHAVRIDHTQREIDAAVALSWQPPGESELTVIPAAALFHAPVGIEQLLVRAPESPVGGAIHLPAIEADYHGASILFNDSWTPFAGHWMNADSWLSWQFTAPPGTYEVSLVYSCHNDSNDTSYVVSVGATQFMGRAVNTRSWGTFLPHLLGPARLAGGLSTLSIKPDVFRQSLVNVVEVVLTPVK